MTSVENNRFGFKICLVFFFLPFLPWERFLTVGGECESLAVDDVGEDPASWLIKQIKKFENKFPFVSKIKWVLVI